MAKERQSPLPQPSAKEAHPQTGSWRSYKVRAPAGSWRSSKAPKKAPAGLNSGELPTTCEGRVIVVMRMEAHDEENADDGPPAWLPVGYAEALRVNSEWLNERTLRRLVRDIVRFARTVHLGEEDPDCCRGEEYLPLILFLLAFLLVSITAVFLIIDWGSVLFPSGSLALMMLALGLCSFCICLRRRRHGRVIVRDPDAVCSDFASGWTASNGLPLTFHLRKGGHSYFELKRPERLTLPMLVPSKQEEEQEEGDDDGWSTVKTPTAASSRATLSTSRAVVTPSTSRAVATPSTSRVVAASSTGRAAV